MPSYFVKNTQTNKGIVVSNKPLTAKTVKLKNGLERTISYQTGDLVFGFFSFPEGNASELGYTKGEVIPVSISKTPVIDQEGNTLDLFWCNPD